MKRIGVFALFLALLAGSPRAAIQVRGDFYGEAKRCSIDVQFCHASAPDTIPARFVPEMFEVTRCGASAESTVLARIAGVLVGDTCTVVTLVSEKLDPACCYDVSFRWPGYRPQATGPLYNRVVSGPREIPAEAFFKRYVIPAFGNDTEKGYFENRFKYEYDASRDKTVGTIKIKPNFETHQFSCKPSFDLNTTDYRLAARRKTPSEKEALGLELSRSDRIGRHRYEISCGYEHDRSRLHLASGDSTVFTHDLALEGSLSLDNLVPFSKINRPLVSTFKGVSLGGGVAWYRSNDKEVWGRAELDETAPFANLRATWTFLFGFQLSYSMYAFWPSSMDGGFAGFHSLRFRLLLGGAFSSSDTARAESGATGEPAKESAKLYRPDLEIAFDTGRRLPLFEKEEKVSIGFVFDLYPWEANPSNPKTR